MPEYLLVVRLRMHLLATILWLVIFFIVVNDLLRDDFEELNEFLAFVLELLKLVEEASKRF